MIKGINETVVFIAAFLIMPVIIWASNKFKASWLREWSLGIVIVSWHINRIFTNITRKAGEQTYDNYE